MTDYDPLTPPGPGETLPAPEVIRKGFDITWIDPDLPASVYSGVTGSAIENGFLSLFRPHRGEVVMVNMAQVLRLHSWDES